MFSIAYEEFKYSLYSFQSLFVAVVLFGFSFLLTANGIEFQSQAQGGMVFINSPYSVSKYLLLFSLIAIFLAPAYLANSVLKDTESKFDSILFSLPIIKSAYFIGRFAGAFLAMSLLFLIAPLAMYLGTYWPWVQEQTLGPHQFSTYMIVYFGYMLPSFFTISALVFSIALLTRIRLMSYLASMAVFILYLAVTNSNVIPIIWDPFMLEVFYEQTKYWNATERNSQLLDYQDIVLSNRLFWALISLVVLTLSFKFYKFEKPATKQKTEKRKNKLQAFEHIELKEIHIQGKPELRQLSFLIRFEIISLLKNKAFIILMAFSLFLLLSALLGRETLYQVKTYPLTRLMLTAISQSLTLALMAVLAFYSSEVIWRERTYKINQIVDATPIENWMFVVSKMIGIVLILLAIVLLGVLISLIIQLSSGYQEIQIGRYISRGLIYYPIAYIYLAILACLLQVLANSRGIGLVLFMLFMVLIALSHDIFEVEHMLFSYALPDIYAPLSDMNFNSRLAEAGIWARVYWGSMAGVFLIMTYLLWNRGSLQPLKYKLKNLKALKNSGFAWPLSLMFILFVSSGSYIFYNTNILNDYYTEEQTDQIQLAYERKYSQYKDLPFPKTVDVEIEVDIFPYKRRVETRSRQILKNKTNQEINTIHITFPFNVDLTKVELQGAIKQTVDTELSYYIFELKQAMLPGDQLYLKFENMIQQQGFPNSNPDTSLLRNGTFLRNTRITPYIGFCDCLMIQDPVKREKYGLKPITAMAKLEDSESYKKNHIRQDSDYINYQAIVSTIEGQKAISPGYLVDQWHESGRSYFKYKMDQPMINMYSFVSAEYQLTEDQWNDTQLSVYYHKNHHTNIETMIQSLKDSLDYYTQVFSSYQYKQLRILEFPAYKKFAQAFAHTIPFSEGIGFIADVRSSDEFNLPYYVTAHETAHQWWGHQVMAAHTQGGVMLLETLAQYSALMVLEKNLGIKQTRKFLKLELEKYLSGRVQDESGELPLYKVEDQDYIYYRKGALIMYALKEYVGEDIINKALKKLIQNHAFESKPYATSLDFLKYLREFAGKEHELIIQDFFEKITMYDFKVNYASVKLLEEGRYKVSIDLSANKTYQDNRGKITPAVIHLPIEIGLFLRHPNDVDFSHEDIIKIEKKVLNSGQSRYEFITSQKPSYVGVDPFNLLIDRNINDNISSVKENNYEK